VRPMLAGQVDHVIGVDTHRDSNTAAIVEAATGGVVDAMQCPTDAMGYKRLFAFAGKHAPGRRVWAIEGTGSYGAGLTTFLLERGEWVVEIDRPARPARRNGAKSDDLDAVRAAREALSRQHLAAPRARGDREAMRVLLAARHGAVIARTKAVSQLKALIVNAPEALRRVSCVLTAVSLYLPAFPLVGRLARLGCTRIGSPSIFGKFGGYGASPRPRSRSSRSAHSSSGSIDQATSSMPACRSPRSAKRAGIVAIVKSSVSMSASSSQSNGADTGPSGTPRTEYADRMVRSRAFWL
jgi:Transposase